MKRWILLTLALFLFAAPLCAAEGLPLVADNAGLLAPEVVAELSNEAGRLSDAYQMDVVLLTTGGLRGQTALDFAADYYDYSGYGRGPEHDGVMLLLSMADRDWAVLTTGGAIAAFTDYGIDAVSDDIVPYFSGGDYAGGFRRFLRDAGILLEQAKRGRPYDRDNPVRLKTAQERVAGVVLPLLIAALVVAGAGLLFLMRGMRTARPQRGADRYVKAGSMEIARAQDLFLYRTQTRVRVQRSESSSSRGGSSTFRSSSGRSHGGRSGKF